jgi:hypothetical protein
MTQASGIFLLTHCELAVLEQNLIANTLDSIQAGVRQRALTPSDALVWAKQANVLEWIQLGPEAKQ